MKKVLFTSLIIAFTVIIAGCGQEQPIQESQETISIGLSASFIDVVESSMTRVGDSNSDIYGVGIRQAGGETYACWVTSDLRTETIKLVKNKRYICYLVYMPKGQEILEGKDGQYMYPFGPSGYQTTKTPAINSGVHYGGNYDIDNCGSGCALKKGYKSNGYAWNEWNDVDIYYGITEICSNEDIDISIELYRMMFGLSVNALNFNEGSISINPRGTYSYQLTPSNPQIDLVVEMGSMPFYEFFPNRAPTTEEMLNWQPNRDAFLSIVYTDPSGLEFSLFDQRLVAKRMTKYTVTIDIDEFISQYNGSLNPSIVDDTWSEESLN